MSKSSNLYRRRYFQTQIIPYCIDSSWLIYQNLWAITVYGVIAFYKPTWCRYKQVGLHFAKQLQPRSQPGDKSNSDEVFLHLNGRIDDRWQTVNQDNNLLSVLAQSRRDQMTVRFWSRPLLKKLCNVLLVTTIHSSRATV